MAPVHRDEKMGYRMVGDTVVFGDPDADTLAQIKRCAEPSETVGSVLCADAHKGYSMPIGGVVAYDGLVSPSGVGFDIACGNKAVRTDLTVEDVRKDLPKIMDTIFNTISFGLGRKNPTPIDHPLFDSPRWNVHPGVAALKKLAREQLGTVGAGNHYVDLLEELGTDGFGWQSLRLRGFGHKTATGFEPAATCLWRYPRRVWTPPAASHRHTVGTGVPRAMRLARMRIRRRDYVVDQVLHFERRRRTPCTTTTTRGKRSISEESLGHTQGATPCH